VAGDVSRIATFWFQPVWGCHHPPPGGGLVSIEQLTGVRQIVTFVPSRGARRPVTLIVLIITCSLKLREGVRD